MCRAHPSRHPPPKKSPYIIPLDTHNRQGVIIHQQRRSLHNRETLFNLMAVIASAYHHSCYRLGWDFGGCTGETLFGSTEMIPIYPLVVSEADMNRPEEGCVVEWGMFPRIIFCMTNVTWARKAALSGTSGILVGCLLAPESSLLSSGMTVTQN